MILKHIKEGEVTSNNADRYNIQIEETEEDKNLAQNIKTLLDLNELKYISDNLKNLLKIEIKNDMSYFEGVPQKRKAVQEGEKFRVILYIRLSQGDEDIKDNNVSRSIKNQLLLLLDECVKKGYVVVGIFAEENLSGIDDSRPEWKKSLKFVELGHAEIYMCKSQSRFTRSIEMSQKYLNKLFQEWNIRFIGLTDNADTSIAANKKSRQIHALTNEWYVEDASVNTRAALKSMMGSGLFIGACPPYGYKKDPKDKHHLIVDDEAKRAVLLMVDMLKKGLSLQRIAEIITREGFKTPDRYLVQKGFKKANRSKIKSLQYMVEDGENLSLISKRFNVTEEEIMLENDLKDNNVKSGDILIIPYEPRWNVQMVRRVLTNPVYTGTLVQGTTERIGINGKSMRKLPESEWIAVPHCHEAIISYETFDEIKEIIQSKTIKRKPNRKGEIHLFSKKVYCSCCGKVFGTNTSVTKHGKQNYLYCRRTSKEYGYICDNNISIRYETLEEYILENIKRKIKEYYDLTKINKYYYLEKVNLNINNCIKELNTKKNKIENDLQKRKSVLANLYDDKVSGIISNDEFILLKNANNLEIKNLTDQIEKINKEIQDKSSIKENNKIKDEIFEKYKDIKKLDRVVLDAFIKKIIIDKLDNETNQRQIKIEWNTSVV